MSISASFRTNAITELFLEVEEVIDALKKIEEEAFLDESIDSLWNPKIKSAFEHLRSILDYSTNDIRSILNIYLKNDNKKEAGDRLYFPYGETYKLFTESIKKNLPGLTQYMPDAYTLIESIQSYKTHSNWLIFFIKETNKIKHFNSTNQEKVKTVDIDCGAFGGTNLSKNTLIFNNCYVNDEHVDGKLEINNGEVISTPNNLSMVTKNNVTFIFKENKEFIIRKIQDTHVGLKSYIYDLYTLLNSYVNNLGV